jgi:hypothetical protein
VLAALSEAAHIAPSILKEQVEAVKHKHRVARLIYSIFQSRGFHLWVYIINIDVFWLTNFNCKLGSAIA